MEKQRALIRDFMEQHGRLAVGHPFATSCAGCRHFLDGSPTKDETVPHCAWADRPRRVHFTVLRPVQGEGPVVPVCRQFAPTDAWETLIPEHPEPADVPREWTREQVLKLAAAGRTYGEAYHPFEFLTGRPMSSSERYEEWFEKQLGEQVGNLSDGQLSTLLVWATAEWQRGLGKPFSLPLNDGPAVCDLQDGRLALAPAAGARRRSAAMNIQMSDLTVSDPLAEQEVAIVIRVLPDQAQRPARTALVSLGVAGQPPAFVGGVLENVDDLIRRAWLAYGVQADVRQRAPGADAAVAETVAEAAIVDEASPNPPVQPQSTKVQPRPQNLSLF